MAEHWNGGNGGKGSKPRPYNISKEEFDDKFTFSWCECEKDDKPTRYNEETQEVLKYNR
jgi:hypothetical protein